MIQLAKSRGAHVITTPRRRKNLASDLGADEVIDHTSRFQPIARDRCGLDTLGGEIQEKSWQTPETRRSPHPIISFTIRGSSSESRRQSLVLLRAAARHNSIELAKMIDAGRENQSLIASPA